MSPRDTDGSSKEKVQQEENNGTSTAATTTTTALACINRDGEGKVAARAEVAEIRATQEMCHHCFDVLIGEMIMPSSSSDSRDRRRGEAGGEPATTSSPSFASDLPSPTTSCPLFVTWDKRRDVRNGLTNGFHRGVSRRRGGGGDHRREYHPSDEDDLDGEEDDDDGKGRHNFELRGCIGTLAPRPLATAVGEYALTSAFRDRRFDPIQVHEVPRLRVAVSLLVKYEECSHCYDWTVGVHGILIKFTHRSSHYSATYLPEVAQEQGWNQEEAVHSLVRKSGFRGVISDDLLDNVGCTRYQSSKDRMTYEDYTRILGRDPLAHHAVLSGGSASAGSSRSGAGAGEMDRGGPKRRGGWRSCFNF